MSENFKHSLYDSFNARHLSPSEVADGFIAPGYFDKLLVDGNNILIGPRGSGKTTLLKMLQIPAIASWEASLKKKHLSNINFVSAFVPTDIIWKEQWSIIDNLILSEETKEQLKESVFLTHVLRSIIETVRHSALIDVSSYTGEWFFSIDRDIEKLICNEVSSTIDIECSIPSIEYLEHCCRRRLMDTGALIRKLQLDSDASSIPNYIFLPFIETISSVISGINFASGKSDQKWALLFDELEIAPKGVRQTLMKLLRSSSDQKLLFKLSISPYSEDFDLFQDASSASIINDYNPINLWYSHKEDARPFCKELFKQVSIAYGISNVGPEDVFGNSEFDLGNNALFSKKSAYKKGSPLYKRFISLYNKDSSFKDYIRRKGVDLENMDLMSEDERANKVRKVTNIVAVRDTFLKKEGVKATKRRPSLYSGATSILDITEGNPRLFLGIVSSLIKLYCINQKRVPPTTQAKAILEASDRFRALLGTIEIQKGSKGQGNLNDILDTIGEFFHDQVVVQKFSSDPPGCFIVDEATTPSMREALGRALNAGAIVYMPVNPGHALLDNLKGKRFRLSNLLAPHYKIPMIASKSRALTSIFRASKGFENTQFADLFDKGE